MSFRSPKYGWNKPWKWRKCEFPWLKPCGSYESNYPTWVANLNPTMPSSNSQVTVLRQERSRSKCRPVQVSSRFISRQFQESKVSSWQRVVVVVVVVVGGGFRRWSKRRANEQTSDWWDFFKDAGELHEFSEWWKITRYIHMWMSWLTLNIYVSWFRRKWTKPIIRIHVWYIYLQLPKDQPNV